MIKAKKIQAIAIPMATGIEAVLVQDGPEWNNLQKFRCVSPPGLVDQTIIAAKDPNNSPLSAMLGELFQIDGYDKWVAVMASPELAAQLKTAGA